MLIQVSGAEVIDSIMQRIDRFTFERFPDLLVKLRKIENGAPIANPVEVRISGDDRRQLFEIVDRVITQSSDAAFHCLTITLFYWESL